MAATCCHTKGRSLRCASSTVQQPERSASWSTEATTALSARLGATMSASCVGVSAIGPVPLTSWLLTAVTSRAVTSSAVWVATALATAWSTSRPVAPVTGSARPCSGPGRAPLAWASAGWMTWSSRRATTACWVSAVDETSRAWLVTWAVS